jgi:hypothetical protein
MLKKNNESKLPLKIKIRHMYVFLNLHIKTSVWMNENLGRLESMYSEDSERGGRSVLN